MYFAQFLRNTYGKGLSIVPEIKYEFSGGAGHYDYAPSFIIDGYGIIYGYLCENREPFKIVDYIYLYKGIPTKTGMYGNRESKYWLLQHMVGMIATYAIPMSENSRQGGKVKNTTI